MKSKKSATFATDFPLWKTKKTENNKKFQKISSILKPGLYLQNHQVAVI